MTVILRPWAPPDANTVLRIATASPDLWRQLPDEADIPELFCAHENGADGRWQFAICVDGEPVGNVAVRMRGMRVGWCSYWVAGDHRGRGLATSGLASIARFSFDELDAYRLELAHRLDNPASGRVAERAGFLPEGVMRAELEYDGVRYDTRMWSRLVTDPAPTGVPLLEIG